MYLDQLYMCMFQSHINNDISFEKTWLRNFFGRLLRVFSTANWDPWSNYYIEKFYFDKVMTGKTVLDEAIVESACQAQCLENLQHVYIQSHFMDTVVLYPCLDEFYI